MDNGSGLTPRDIVAAVQENWARAFEQRDLPRLTALYTQDALFYGSTAELHRGRDGVLSYFATLPPRFTRARFAVPELVVSKGIIAASGPVVFEVEEQGVLSALPYRMTHLLLQQDEQWLIATHHASPAPSEGHAAGFVRHD